MSVRNKGRMDREPIVPTPNICERSGPLPRRAPGRPPGPAPAGCRLALAIAAAAFDVAPEAISAPRRGEADVAAARHVAIYLAHVVYQAPMRAVGEAFGRDRTSVAHALRRIEDRRDEPDFDRRMERLERLASFCGPARGIRP